MGPADGKTTQCLLRKPAIVTITLAITAIPTQRLSSPDEGLYANRRIKKTSNTYSQASLANSSFIQEQRLGCVCIGELEGTTYIGMHSAPLTPTPCGRITSIAN